MSHEYDSTYINDELEDPDATINDTNANGNNLAMRALIEDGRLSSNDLKALIEAGLDVNHQNNKGQTLLMLMSDYFVDDRELEYIVQKGADIGLRDNEGKTALDYTIENRIDNIGKAITLIELGASTGDRLVLFKVFDAMEEDYGKEHDNAIEMYGKIITGLLSIGADPTLKKPKTQEFDEISIFGRFLNVVRDFEDHPLKEAISEILTPLINAVKEDASELVLDDLMTNALFHAFRGGHGNLILADTFIKAGGNPTDLYIEDEEDEEDVGPDKVAFLKKQKASYKRKQTRTTAASSTAVPPRVIEDLSELLTQTLRRAANASENDRSELYEEAKSLVREGAKMPTAEQVFHGTIPTVDALRRVVNFIGSQPAAPAAAAQSSGCPPCPAILKSGKNKGKVCGAPGRYGGYCGVHKQAQQ